jgi:ADP-heptose:LPS heptosyltransferase
MLYPLPRSAPWRHASLHIARGDGVGDVLLCTPALREIKRLNPRCHITFYTNHPSLLYGLELCDEVRPFADRPRHALVPSYEHTVPPQRHLAQIVGDSLGVSVADVTPTCAINKGHHERLSRILAQHGRPIVVVNRKAGPWTPNKDWPDSYWMELLQQLLSRHVVVEIGAKGEAILDDHEHYLDFRARTTLEELIALMAAADVHVGPISGPVHIAAAVGTPSVVIYGGYEHPRNSHYDGNIDLHSSPPCAPCWLTSACPHEKRCLTVLTPAMVLEAILSKTK